MELQQREQQLRLLALSLTLAMATWFSTAAISPQLRTEWGLNQEQAALLTIAVQIGFVIGSVASALVNLADRVSPHRLIFLGAAGAALMNLLLITAGSLGPGLLLRLLTGVCLAAVYPPGLKAMSGWYRTDRGFALGVMIAALTIGSALPHLVGALVAADWKVVLLLSSSLSLLGGAISEISGREGPHSTGPTRFDPAFIRRLVANRRFQLASIGYFGHMWELYAMWAWIGAFYVDALGPGRRAGFVTFGVIAIGAAGSVYAGLISDTRSRPAAASLALRGSGSVALVVGFLIDAPAPIVVGVGLVWGFWVVADSAQFSTIVTEVVERSHVGTALTVQLAAGFVLTVLTIFIVPVIRDSHGWGWAFFVLAPGPLLGSWAMQKLEKMTQPEPDPQPEPPTWVSPFF